MSRGFMYSMTAYKQKYDKQAITAFDE